jgi:predicted nucleotidyltransferase component of viral defense system
VTGRSRNIGASVRARLSTRSKEHDEEFDYVLNRYATERLLHRLSCSEMRDDFVLKGATLLRVWAAGEYRPTRDVDFLAFGSHDLEQVASRIRALCEVDVPDDGIVFHARTVKAERIKEDQEYEGVRVRLEAVLDRARIPMQIDIGFGDAVQPVEEDYPVLLPGSATPRLRVYPREAVVAEKVQAMVHLGLANSRMKDFYDVDHLAHSFAFDGTSLLAAVQATFERRATVIPMNAPLALTATFSNDASKQTQWKAFLRRTSLPAARLEDVVQSISRFVVPVFEAHHDGQAPSAWPRGGPWAASGRGGPDRRA